MIKKLIAMTVVLSMLAVPTVALAQIDIGHSLKKLELGIKNLRTSQFPACRWRKALVNDWPSSPGPLWTRSSRG